MSREPTLDFSKISIAKNSLTFDRVEQGERPFGILAMQVILDHVEDGNRCAVRRKFLSPSAGAFACHWPICSQVVVARVFCWEPPNHRGG